MRDASPAAPGPGESSRRPEIDGATGGPAAAPSGEGETAPQPPAPEAAAPSHPGPAPTEPDVEAALPSAAAEDPNALLAEARALIQSDDYRWALAVLRRALKADPGLERRAGGATLRRLEWLVAELELDGNAARQDAYAEQAGPAGRAAKSAIGAFAQGRDIEAVLEASVAVGEDPQTEAYRLLLAALAQKTALAAPKEELLPRSALVQLKLQRAERHVLERRFGEAARECQEAVWLDPRNAQAWTRLGSTRWASGDPQRAREAFEQTLLLDPKNAEVREFMRSKGLVGMGRSAKESPSPRDNGRAARPQGEMPSARPQ